MGKHERQASLFKLLFPSFFSFAEDLKLRPGPARMAPPSPRLGHRCRVHRLQGTALKSGRCASYIDHEPGFVEASNTRRRF